MDVSEYRKQYTEQLERAAVQQTSYRDFLDKSKPVAERRMALNNTARLLNEDDINESINIIRDKDEDVELRASALYAISTDIGSSHELINMVLALLGDEAEPPELRMSALRVLQVISFSSSIFVSKRPEYLATLRSVVDDKDTKLRQQAIEILAIQKDEYAQRRLIEGLEGHAKALVGTSKAIQLLGYDIHAEHYLILRKIIQNPPSRAAKKEAVRLLAADPSSKNLLTEIFRDKDEHKEVRKISAIALQSIAPDEFEDAAKQTVLDEEEDDDLRATCINALEHFANQASLSHDSEFNQRVEQLRERSTSKQLKQATASYISKFSI